MVPCDVRVAFGVWRVACGVWPCGLVALWCEVAVAACGVWCHYWVCGLACVCSELVASLGFAPGFTCARMYKGTAPALPLHRIYGVGTLELG